jgi:hypothetical protein
VQPTPDATQTPLDPARPAQPSGGGLGTLILGIVLAVIAGVLLWLILRVVARARRRPLGLSPLAQDGGAPAELVESRPDEDAEPDAPIVHRGLRLALEALSEDRLPGDAVVRAWLGLQQAAEDSGVERRAAETPTEFTARVITRVRADQQAAGALVDVYQEVRFGAHPVTPADVASARAAIEALLASWHEPALGRRR